MSNEEYGTRVAIPGIGDFTHLDDPIYPAETALPVWPRKTGDWQQFWSEKLAPTENAGGGMLWQICDHECAGRILLDESVLRARKGEPGGYVAISSFHFGCWNMAFATPYVMRYRHEVPLIALQDAHGESWFWRKELRNYRTLFLAAEPTWNGWMKALRKGWVVAVRQDTQTQDRLRMMGGSADVRRAFRERQEQWNWLAQADCPGLDVAVALLTPEDKREPGCSADGTVLRIRTNRQWVEGKELWFVDPPITCETVLADGKEIPFETHTTTIEDGWLKGKVRDEITLATVPHGTQHLVGSLQAGWQAN